MFCVCWDGQVSTYCILALRSGISSKAPVALEPGLFFLNSIFHSFEKCHCVIQIIYLTGTDFGVLRRCGGTCQRFTSDAGGEPSSDEYCQPRKLSPVPC